MKITIELTEPKNEADCLMMAAIASGRGKFELGNVCATRGVTESFSEAFAILCLTRHALGDWGDLGEEDKERNNLALIGDERILSAYKSAGKKLYIITEWNRKLTTILLPEEY